MDSKELAERNLIYKVRTGSHAYDTNLDTSDIDFAGIFIPPIEYYFGLQSFDLLSESSKEDHSYYSVRKYATLAVANNPNVLELLFVDNRDVLLATPAASTLRTNRHLFLSQKCQKTFVGYAKAQLHRIRTHTKWLAQELADMAILDPLVSSGKVTREWVAWRFGENMVERVESVWRPLSVPNPWGNDKALNDKELVEIFKGSSIICPQKDDERFLKDDTLSTGLKVKVFQKHIYDEAKKKRDQYVTWMAERSPVRHETEIKFGYDTKHAMHLIRLLRMGYEALTTGDLIVRRPDAKELLDIRAGKWTYEEVVKYADEMVEKIDGLGSEGCKLPASPDMGTIDRMVVRITKEYLEGYHEDNT